MRIGQQALQPSVLILKHLQPFGLAHLQATILALPLVKGAFSNAMLPANVQCALTCLLLLKDPNNLLFRETALLHVCLLATETTFKWTDLKGAGHQAKVTRYFGDEVESKQSEC